LSALFSISIIVATTILSILSTHAYSQENKDSVVLVHLIFKDENWSVGPDEVLVLPCAAPTKFIRGTESDPLIRVLGSNNEPVYQRQMNNPRLILIEDPKEEPLLLEEVSFKLRFELMDGMEILEFWYDSLEQKEPSLIVDLRDAIKRYLEAGGPDQKAPCQQPEYVPDQLQK